MANYKKMAKNAKLEAGKLMTEKQVKACNVIIHTASVACGGCGAIPIPIADAIPMTTVQITMVISLGKVFDINLTESAAKSIISAAAATLIGRAAVGAGLKFIPVAGWIAGAVVAAAVTEALGWGIANDFAKQYRTEYRREREKEKSEEDIRKAVYEAEEKFADNIDDLNDPDNYI